MRETIWQEKFQADIFAPDFCRQLQIEQTVIPSKDQPFYYDLDIQVPLVSLRQPDRIEAYLSLRQVHSLRGQAATSVFLKERGREIMEIFQSLGYQIQNTCISGEELGNSGDLILTLRKGPAKEYFACGSLKPAYCVVRVIPDKTQFMTLVTSTIAEQITKSIQKTTVTAELGQQARQTIHLGVLLQTIAQEITTQEGRPETAEDVLRAMLDGCCVHKHHPLKIKGDPNISGGTANPAQILFYPKWLVYREKTDKAWSISAPKASADVRHEVEQFWRRKNTVQVIIFHHMKPISYSLMAKGANGFTKIQKETAPQYSALEVVWDEIIN